jgi:hypothetical protein
LETTFTEQCFPSPTYLIGKWLYEALDELIGRIVQRIGRRFGYGFTSICGTLYLIRASQLIVGAKDLGNAIALILDAPRLFIVLLKSLESGFILDVGIFALARGRSGGSLAIGSCSTAWCSFSRRATRA